ncbi:hypothetical protein DM02DRAFT_619577 [Periconia macrospinosa]|uniref:Uncharacterized protein n=1 Tax=Periconia macrospinosa TaxID=97972 RepID=A0A2V1D6V7_9PLEO|nr:hypothetical protein DM02DRAFT_619577 [Periconia macrospinosa]
MFSFNSKTQPYCPQSSTWPAGRLKEEQASIAAERKVSDNVFVDVGTGAQGSSEKMVGKKAQSRIERSCGREGNGDTEIIGEAKGEAEPNPEHVLLKALSQSGYRQFRGHESRLLPTSNAISIEHSDVSTKDGRRKRHNQR